VPCLELGVAVSRPLAQGVAASRASSGNGPTLGAQEGPGVFSLGTPGWDTRWHSWDSSLLGHLVPGWCPGAGTPLGGLPGLRGRCVGGVRAVVTRGYTGLSGAPPP